MMKPEEHFILLCSCPHHRDAALKLYNVLPKKIRYMIDSHWIHITDWFDKSSNPRKSIDGERLGCFIEGGRAIYITPKMIFSEEALIGLFAHEIAHVYIYYQSFRFLSRFYYRVKFRYQSNDVRLRYNYYKKSPDEEYHADCLVRKWGLGDYREKLWSEMLKKN